MDNKLSHDERSELMSFLVVVDLLCRDPMGCPVDLVNAKAFLMNWIEKRNINEKHFDSIVETIFWFFENGLHTKTFKNRLGNDVRVNGQILLNAALKFGRMRKEYFPIEGPEPFH